ncbi:aldo/keto reductase, partial [Flavobacteriaceae bacterium]|nr:aldo/keto reductase [Flavobacteriaceae bacterium]
MNSKLILGTVQFGFNYGINNTAGKPSKENIKSILDLAYSSGIQLLDTAEVYGDSQNKIGEYH